MAHNPATTGGHPFAAGAGERRSARRALAAAAIKAVECRGAERIAWKTLGLGAGGGTFVWHRCRSTWDPRVDL